MKKLSKHLHEKLKKAEALELKKDYRSAIKEYRSILEKEKKLPQVWFKAGSLYSKTSRSKKALVCFEQAIRHGYPRKLYYSLGIEYFKLKNYKMAFNSMQKCIQDAPKFLPAFLMSAVIADRQANIIEAIISIENLLRVDPNHRGAHSAMIILNSKKKEYKKAFHHLEILRSLGENKHILNRLKARVLMDKGDLKESIDLLKDISRENPETKKIHSTMKKEISIHKKKEISAKREKIEKKITKKSSEWLDLSLLSLFEGDMEKAMNSLKQALYKK